jgi:transcriptional regulator with XRE-family HTH domain
MKKKQLPEKKNLPLGEFIKARRTALGLTRMEVSKAAGLDYSYIGKLESGEYRMPSPEALRLVAAAIETKPADLYVLAGYKIGGELPGFGPYLRSHYHLPPEAIDQLESYFNFLRHQYGISDDEPVFPPKPRPEGETDERRAA